MIQAEPIAVAASSPPSRHAEGNRAGEGPRILKVENLLSLDRLTIPEYQRPYKWTTRNVQALFSDLARHADKSAYRLGSIVFHREGGRLDLVDGQQRTITLLLAVRAILGRADLKSPALKESLVRLKPKVEGLCDSFTFDSEDSKRNLKLNYEEILRIVSRSDFTEKLVLNLLQSCEVVVFTLDDISEAFQFFDSQNARGRDLDPHDLLKAYHLREFGPAHEQGELMTRAIEKWEGLESSQLACFFENYWFRIRSWSRGEAARYFGKTDVGIFKGVNPSTARRYPNTQLLRIAHFFTDHHERQYERQIDAAVQPFPFQFDQVILNGRRFFEMTSHYLEMAARFTSNAELKDEGEKHTPRFPEGVLDDHVRKIIEVLDQYDGRHRRGDQYVRNLFDCLLLSYIDRFGLEQISRAIEKIFIWAYDVRLGHERVLLASIDNHALAEPCLFHVLRDATSPEEFLQIPMPPLRRVVKDVKEITDLFKKMKYLTA